jgi:hypothetical protein
MVDISIPLLTQEEKRTREMIETNNPDELQFTKVNAEEGHRED